MQRLVHNPILQDGMTANLTKKQQQEHTDHKSNHLHLLFSLVADRQEHKTVAHTHVDDVKVVMDEGWEEIYKVTKKGWQCNWIRRMS